jgi:predicted lysophospholipase L1 biosynthesis ABC-type transport system permease subunit
MWSEKWPPGIRFFDGESSILNFINAILTSILTRRKEFAMLQSIGMTRKQLCRMLMYEDLYYVLGTCARFWHSVFAFDCQILLWSVMVFQLSFYLMAAFDCAAFLISAWSDYSFGIVCTDRQAKYRGAAPGSGIVVFNLY